MGGYALSPGLGCPIPLTVTGTTGHMSNLDRSLLIERTRRVYENSLRGMPFSFMVGGLVVAGLETARGSTDLIGWWAALAVLTLVRHNHARRAIANRAFQSRPESLSAWFTVGAALEGLMWGVSFLLVAQSSGGTATVFMGCALAGLSVAALTSMASGRLAFPAYLGGMFIPVLGSLVVMGEAHGASIGAMAILFALNLFLAFLHAHAADTAELKLKFEQQATVRALAEANRRIEIMSRTDALTGLANRREFDERLEIEWLRSERTGSPLGLILLDIDRFKEYNDAGGHPAGDECLRRVSAALRSAVHRPSDLVARFGGEEFAVLLPEGDSQGVQAVAEHIRQTVESLALPRPVGPEKETPSSGATGVRAINRIVTLSAGAASVRASEVAGGSAMLVELADAAMYDAKQGGRNRVHMRHPPKGAAA
jgi:diguanylate cyclase (GGDEF)-like protein